MLIRIEGEILYVTNVWVEPSGDLDDYSCIFFELGGGPRGIKITTETDNVRQLLSYYQKGSVDVGYCEIVETKRHYYHAGKEKNVLDEKIEFVEFDQGNP